jgi:hypothetical protein
LVRNAATNTCVTAPAVVCAAPLQVRDAVTNTCVAAPAVVCAAPLQVRDAATNTCVAAPAVVCEAPLVRNAVTNTCIVSEDASITACGQPTITAPKRVAVHAGTTLKLGFTALDCADRPITMTVGQLPTSPAASVVSVIVPELYMSESVITWAVPATIVKAQKQAIILNAAANDGAIKVSAAPKTVWLEVLPAVQNVNQVEDSIVRSNNVVSSRFNATTQKLEVSGQVLWRYGSNTQERQSTVNSETAEVKDATNGAYLGTAVVALDGTWKASIPLNEASTPCSVDVSFNGKTGVRVVSGIWRCDK